MARFEEKALAADAWKRRAPLPCPARPGAPCLGQQTPPTVSLHQRWENAISRLQGAVACSPDCPLADHLLAVVRTLGSRANPLSEVFPELDPAPAAPRVPQGRLPL